MTEIEEAQAILEHYNLTGRTPLAVPYKTTKLNEDHFKRFDLLINQLPEDKKRIELFKATQQLERRIKIQSSYIPEVFRQKYYPEQLPDETLLFYMDKKEYYQMLFDNTGKNNPDKPKRIVDTLEKACKGTAEYDFIKEWFIDQSFCNPDPFEWNSKKFTLSCLAGYLKDLEKKGYTIKITQLQIKEIAKNSFNAVMEIDTIKRAKKQSPEIPYFK
jgi:hypothetical protein